MSSVVEDLKSFKKHSNAAYLFPPKKFLIVGDETLIIGTLKRQVRTPQCIHLSATNKAPKISSTEIKNLFKRASKLGTKSIIDFTLNKADLKRIVALSDELNSTHIRLFKHEERGIVARLFDVRIGSDILLPRMKRIHASATINLNVRQAKDFSVTLSRETVVSLPADDLLISVYDDGILEAEPVHGKQGEKYLCRDQEIVEPYTSFTHEKLKRTTYFVFHPYE